MSDEQKPDEGKEAEAAEDAKTGALCRRCSNPDDPTTHDGSTMCRSGSIASGGKRPHCTCNACF